MNKKGIFLMSLNSRKLKEFLNKEEAILSLDDKIWDVFVFDMYETLTGLFFNSTNVEKQNIDLESLIASVQDKLLDSNFKNRNIIRFSEIPKIIKPYLSCVYNEYYGNDSFRRHCNSQIFQNLQPKLRSVGITNHKSSLIELLSPFLLAEIAFYLYIYDTGTYDNIYGLEGEMGIIETIRGEKYDNFTCFLEHEIPHIKVNF